VAPHNSYEKKFGTNPIAIAIPTPDGKAPLVLDMATSSIAYYGLVEAKTAGRAVAEGLGFDSQGRPTTDPAQIMAGAIKPFGGHKGGGLSLMVAILAGPLVRAAFAGREDAESNWGNLVVAISPDLLAPSERFTQEVQLLLQRVKAAKPIPGVKQLYLPGEKGNRTAEEAKKTGEVEIEEKLWRSLQEVAARAGPSAKL